MHHKWFSGARFLFNCCCNWAILVIRAGDGKGHFIRIKEGVTQGYPLSMIAYGLQILPLIWDLQMAHPNVTQPWYADDAGAGGTFVGIYQHIDNLMVQGPCGDISWIQQRAYWSCLHRMSCKRRHSYRVMT